MRATFPVIIRCPDCGRNVRRQGDESVDSALFWHRLGWNGACQR